MNNQEKIQVLKQAIEDLMELSSAPGALLAGVITRLTVVLASIRAITNYDPHNQAIERSIQSVDTRNAIFAHIIPEAVNRCTAEMKRLEREVSYVCFEIPTNVGAKKVIFKSESGWDYDINRAICYRDPQVSECGFVCAKRSDLVVRKDGSVWNQDLDWRILVGGAMFTLREYVVVTNCSGPHVTFAASGMFDAWLLSKAKMFSYEEAISHSRWMSIHKYSDLLSIAEANNGFVPSSAIKKGSVVKTIPSQELEMKSHIARIKKLQEELDLVSASNLEYKERVIRLNGEINQHITSIDRLKNSNSGLAKEVRRLRDAGKFADGDQCVLYSASDGLNGAPCFIKHISGNKAGVLIYDTFMRCVVMKDVYLQQLEASDWSNVNVPKLLLAEYDFHNE